MKVEINEVFPVAIEEEGTIMDYVDDEFVFVIKDEEWTEFELKAMKRNAFEIDMVEKYGVVLFLITVLDAIDTSDFIFNIHDNEYPDTLFTTQCMPCSLYLIDQQNVVKAFKQVTLSKESTKIIQDTLKKVQESVYYEEEFNCNLEGIQNTWEPFELQEFAIMKESF